MLIALAVRSMMMPNGVEGLKFFFDPDFSKVTSKTFLDAMGQAFFSLSIGLGCMITYSSYFNDKTNLQKTAFNVIALDTLVAVLAGLVIFPAVFSVGIEPTSGPSLVFITLPSIFNTMTFGPFWSALFFLLLILAALTSTISLHEVLTAYLHEERGLSRKGAAWIVTISTALLACASSLSLGAWGKFKILGLNIFDSLDFVTANILLPLGGLLTSIFAGWVLDRKILHAEVSEHGSMKCRLFGLLVMLLRYVCPALLLWIFLYNLGLFRL
jgi:NSS family neurotransmitter:Na+ symporter